MSKMRSLVLNENMKIYRRLRTWIMAGIIFAVNLLMAIIIYFNTQTFQFEPSYLEFFNISQTGLNIFLIVFSAVIAADIVASEFSWGTIKLLLIRPVQRWKILLSKYIAVLMFCLFMIIVLIASSLSLGLIFFGTGGTSSLTFLDVLGKIGFKFVELLMTVTIAFMVSAVFRSSMLAIALSFVVIFLGGTISGILIAFDFEWAKYLLFTNMDLTIYEGSSPFVLPGMSMGFSIAVLVAYFVIFHLISFFIFVKRDVAS